MDLAYELKSEVEAAPGFISVERFTSVSGDGTILSLSLWQDEDSVNRWRLNGKHADAQAQGRKIFDSYRIYTTSLLRMTASEHEHGTSDI